jgi:hypothetical protein
MAINACLRVGTLYPRLKSDLGIAGRRMSRHFVVVNLYMTMRSLYKNDKYETDEHIPHFIYIRIHGSEVQWLVLYEFVGRQVRRKIRPMYSRADRTSGGSVSVDCILYGIESIFILFVL